jgi:hypothetical protein
LMFCALKLTATALRIAFQRSSAAAQLPKSILLHVMLSLLDAISLQAVICLASCTGSW